jgi:hypothetical protein
MKINCPSLILKFFGESPGTLFLPGAGNRSANKL